MNNDFIVRILFYYSSQCLDVRVWRSGYQQNFLLTLYYLYKCARSIVLQVRLAGKRLHPDLQSLHALVAGVQLKIEVQHGLGTSVPG